MSDNVRSFSPSPASFLASSADGWRGRIGIEFTPANVALLSKCVLERFKDGGVNTVLISQDSREVGRHASRIVETQVNLQFPGATVLLLPNLPTPIASAYLARGLADLAILITASHNPSNWNGLKVKIKPGMPLSEVCENAINAAYLEIANDGGLDLALGINEGISIDYTLQMQHTKIAIESHLVAMIERIEPVPTARLRVVIDGLGGIAGTPAKRICEMLGHDVTALGDTPTSDFDGLVPDPTLRHSQLRCAKIIVENGADIGFVLDGDGDRVIALTRNGDPIQSQELLSLILIHSPLRTRSKMSGDILATTTCGLMIREVARQRHQLLTETPIGFKHIARYLTESENSIGVGSVGDIGFSSYTTDRDPFAIIALTLLMLAHSRLPIDSLLEELRRQFCLSHLSWREEHVRSLAANIDQQGFAEMLIEKTGWHRATIEKTIDGTRVFGPNSQWFLVRKSTSEGGLRLYGEFTQETQSCLDSVFTPRKLS
jgi:phosphomannomutase